jgi:hypothetical protein
MLGEYSKKLDIRPIYHLGYHFKNLSNIKKLVIGVVC